MRRIFVLVFLALFLIIPPSFAGITTTIVVGAASIDCNGNVTIPVQTDSVVDWSLTIDGTPSNLGFAFNDFTITGSVVPQDNHIFTFDMVINTQPYTRFGNTDDCEENVPRIVCDDGRINIECDLVAIYPIEDDDGIHMSVWYVLPGDGANGQFAFMLYADELNSLSDNPDEPILIASSTDNFVNLYWMPDNSYQITAGPDGEGKTRVFVFDNFPDAVTAYTEE